MSDNLTQQVYYMFHEGYTYKAISEALHVKPRKVEYTIELLRKGGIIQKSQEGSKRKPTLGRKKHVWTKERVYTRLPEPKPTEHKFIPRGEGWNDKEKWPKWKPGDNVYAFILGEELKKQQ